MTVSSQIITLLKKDIRLEWKQRYAFNGILVYVISTVFIAYIGVKTLAPPQWNALYWIILLFAAITASAKSFIQESQGRMLYYYTIASATAVIFSKIIYNSLLMLLLAFLCLFFYTLWMGNPVQDLLFFCINMVLGSIGFASAFTLISAIASKSGNGNMIMPILSFPVILPLVMVLIKSSKAAMDGLNRELFVQDFGVLVGINVALVVLSYVLFNFVWKE